MTVERRRIVTLIVAIILAIPATAIIFYNNDGSVEGITVTDMRDRTVTVPNDVDRIVCLSAGSLRFVEYLGAVDMVVGIDKKDSTLDENYYKATYHIAYDVTHIDEVSEDSKVIISTGAQLIISSETDVSKLNDLQEKTGIPTIGINAEGSNTVAGDVFKKNIELLGKVLGKEDRAKELIDGVASMITEITGMRDISTKVGDVKCYIGGLTYYMTEKGLYETTGNFEPFTLTGLVNVMPDVKEGLPYPTSEKTLVMANPDYMFVDGTTLTDSKTRFDSDRNILSDITAVKEGNIYSLFCEKYYGTNWESELMNSYYIGNLIDPTAFSYNVEEKMNAVLKLFYNGSDITIQDLVEKQGSGVGKLDW